MEYAAIYEAIIKSANSQDRSKGGDQYFERHHKIPRCIGGSDEPSNLVLLTDREHYIAHILLAKAYPEEIGLVYAAKMMTSRTPGSRNYQFLKEAYSKAVSNNLSGRRWSDEEKARRFTPEIREIYSERARRQQLENPIDWNKERRAEHSKTLKDAIGAMSDEVRKKTYARHGSMNGRFGKPFTRSEEAKAKCSAALKGVPKKKIPCPHCAKELAPNVAKRWHFDNCKLKEN